MDKHAVVHFEIYGEDPEKLASFYSRLFGWTIEEMPELDYRFIKTVDTDAKGMPKQGNPFGLWQADPTAA